MLISKLLFQSGIEYKNEDKDIKYITDDSRKVREDTLFVCHEKGEDYVRQAIEKGAVAVVAEKEVCENTIITEDTRKTYSLLCAAFFGFSHKKLRLIGVTGTNGKTTVSTMIYNILTMAGHKCALFGTVCNKLCGESSESVLTTPDSFYMHKKFREMTECNTEYCIIEASSQGLIQQRLYGLDFEVGVFLNLTEDHLDYHGDMESYKNAKRLLFSSSRLSVINDDDSYRDDFISAAAGEVKTYSLKSDEADFTAKCIKFSEGVTDYAIVSDGLIHRIKLKIPGAYNVSNSMAAIITALSLGVSLDSCSAALRNFYGVRGRFEIVPTDRDFKIIIDYAHTPDSLRQVLLTLGSFPKNRIITVFGCGGDRDREKRGGMGKIAADYSDMVIVTSDNPRDEEPMDIIRDIVSAVKSTRTPMFIRQDRRKAIEFALKNAQENDIILLAGKGHETTQTVRGEEIPMDERKIIRELLG
ncbi:MAG: UDP-N-acetylmuramoyl-L-alanyl-D-glutamate--2,6-diaminopimelate ligase [Ruminococcaceae bacterium]|nr:UDP-N-acetylmuramoyl-L-alanyl-D-glutamate--2,6-diaminopimelate ligase [Oscillospiraceae bacterium]